MDRLAISAAAQICWDHVRRPVPWLSRSDHEHALALLEGFPAVELLQCVIRGAVLAHDNLIRHRGAGSGWPSAFLKIACSMPLNSSG